MAEKKKRNLKKTGSRIGKVRTLLKKYFCATINLVKKAPKFLAKDLLGMPIYVWGLLFVGGVVTICYGLVGKEGDLNGFITVGLAIAGGGFFMWRSKSFERQVNTQEAGLVVQRWKDSIQLLSSSNPGVLIGGIESLYQVTMENSKTYGESAIKILYEFVQNRSEDIYNKRVKEFEEAGKKTEEVKESFELFNRKLGPFQQIKSIPNEIIYAFNYANTLRHKIKPSPGYLPKVIVSDCTFPRAGFCSLASKLGVYLEYIIFMNVKFIESVFTENDLSGINFIACDLSGASFLGITCEKAPFTFSSCDLTMANFFEKSTLTGVKFISVNLTVTDFSGAENLTLEQLKGTFYTIHPITGKREDGRPKLPDYLSEESKLQYYKNHYVPLKKLNGEGPPTLMSMPINLELYKKWLGKGTPTNPTTPPPS